MANGAHLVAGANPSHPFVVRSRAWTGRSVRSLVLLHTRAQLW